MNNTTCLKVSAKMDCTGEFSVLFYIGKIFDLFWDHAFVGRKASTIIYYLIEGFKNRI